MVEEEISTEEESRGYPQRHRNPPECFVAGSLRRTRTEDEAVAREALKSNDAERWVESMNGEVIELHNLKFWTVVDRPQDAQELHSKFVFKKKRDSTGEVGKYKARLVFCGNEDVDFNEESNALVVDFGLVKLFLAIAIHRGWKVTQFDFDNAFPNWKLDRDI